MASTAVDEEEVDVIRTLAACLVVLSASAATAAPKTLSCERLYKAADGVEQAGSRYRVAYDPADRTFRFAMEAGTLQSKEPPAFDLLERWEVGYASEDGLRVVGLRMAPIPPDSLQSPVRVVDVDFGLLKINIDGFGGYLDLKGDELIPVPNRMECRRLD